MNCRQLFPHALLLSLATMLNFSSSGAESDQAAQLPAGKPVQLYLMMGQSNMSGRGVVDEEDRTSHPRVFMFTTNATWQLATEPVTHDKPKFLGVGPGLAFGKALAEKYPDTIIGLVPCSVGGTPLSRWQKSGDLYSNAVHRAKLAMQSGTIKGVIWHQGESDSNPAHAKTYGARLGQMIRDLRADLNAPELPFVAGQLGEFLYTRGSNNVAEVKMVNAAIANLPQAVPHTAFVSSEKLGHKGDMLHFDAAAQRELGRRYAREMIRLQVPWPGAPVSDPAR
jgi:hypothetical protein